MRDQRQVTMPETKLNDYDRVKKVLCSSCKKEFKAGQRYFGQARGEFWAYGNVQTKDGIYAIPEVVYGESVILDYFHEECLR